MPEKCLKTYTEAFYPSNIYEYKLQSVCLRVHKCNFNVACYSPTWFPLMQPYPGTFKGSCLVRAIKNSRVHNAPTFLIRAWHAGWQYYHNKPRCIFIASAIVAVSKTKYGWNNVRGPYLKLLNEGGREYDTRSSQNSICCVIDANTDRYLLRGRETETFTPKLLCSPALFIYLFFTASGLQLLIAVMRSHFWGSCRLQQVHLPSISGLSKTEKGSLFPLSALC